MKLTNKQNDALISVVDANITAARKELLVSCSLSVSMLAQKIGISYDSANDVAVMIAIESNVLNLLADAGYEYTVMREVSGLDTIVAITL